MRNRKRDRTSVKFLPDACPGCQTGRKVWMSRIALWEDATADSHAVGVRITFSTSFSACCENYRRVMIDVKGIAHPKMKFTP